MVYDNAAVDWASLAKQWISQKEAADVHIQQQQQQLHHEALHRQGEFFAQLPPPPPPPPPDECEDGAPTEASLHSHHLISEPNRSPLCEKTADDENHMDISDDETGSIGRKEARNGEAMHQCINYCLIMNNCYLFYFEYCCMRSVKNCFRVAKW